MCFCCWLRFRAGGAGTYDALLPKPQVLVQDATRDVVARAMLAKATFHSGVIAGAPSAVGDQAYRLEIASEGVRVTHGGVAGRRYAETTLRQLAALAGTNALPAATIVDWPALKWRGFMLDTGRNFLEERCVRAVIDLMADYKMNLFHWHFTEYHGWRLESKKYPHLTHPDTMLRQVGKFYSRDFFRETVAYAKSRGVTIMPEFDVPGHSLALRKGLGVETMADPNVATALGEIIAEACAGIPADDMPFIHLGTDEVKVAEEKVPPGWCTQVANAVAAQGRKVVVWTPGQQFSCTGEIIDMVYWDNHNTNSCRRAFDAARMYCDGIGPQLLLNHAAFVKPCRWDCDATRKLGAIACAWHDDNVGEDTSRMFATVMIAPDILAYSETYWHGNAEDMMKQYGSRLPPRGTAAFARAVDLETRILAQKERVLVDFPYAFPFARQTDMHWVVRDEDGTVLDADYAGAIIDATQFTAKKRGVITAETRVWSAAAREVGVWIDFMATGSSYMRRNDGPMPPQGEWCKYGSYAELNGERIAPPRWDHPNLRVTKPRDANGITYHGVCFSDDCCETPIGNEWSYTRAPTRLRLRQGWNDIRLVLRHPKGIEPAWFWRGVFQFVAPLCPGPQL